MVDFISCAVEVQHLFSDRGSIFFIFFKINKRTKSIHKQWNNQLHWSEGPEIFYLLTKCSILLVSRAFGAKHICKRETPSHGSAEGFRSSISHKHRNKLKWTAFVDACSTVQFFSFFGPPRRVARLVFGRYTNCRVCDVTDGFSRCAIYPKQTTGERQSSIIVRVDELHAYYLSHHRSCKITGNS